MLGGAAAARAEGFTTYRPIEALAGWRAPDSFQFYSPVEARNWKVGAYAGVYDHGRLLYLAYMPWRTSARDLDSSGWLFAANATYRMLDFPFLPISIELDAMAGVHAGRQGFLEFGVLPMFRWRWFPWNDFVYTTYRMGVIGPNYATAISTLEQGDTYLRRTARFLNFYVSEFTFSSSETANWEAFVRIHHRSGAYGRVNGVHGGSNYVSVGARFALQ